MSHILLVDDDELFRKMLRLTLVKMGHVVREARDGAEAVKFFEEEMPDLVMTDLIMPNKEGLETISELRERYPEVKIIAMSGGGRLSGTDYLRMAKGLGANAVLTKPFSNEELGAILKKILGKAG